MTTMTSKLCRGALVAAALIAAPAALAGPPSVNPEMQRALAKADEGPDVLRQYLNRTRMIYGLNYNDVMTLHEAIKAAQAEASTNVAGTQSR
jgi:hypothetical protein